LLIADANISRSACGFPTGLREFSDVGGAITSHPTQTPFELEENSMSRQAKVVLDPKAMAGGCWVIIYEDEGYQDASLLITGPAEFSNLRGLPGAGDKDWGDDIDSIVVGPGCWLQVFADEGFGDTSAWYGPNTHAPGLGDMGDEIDSMRLFNAPQPEYFDFLRRKEKKEKGSTAR